MKRFQLGQRIVIDEPVDKPLRGMRATVVRLRRGDDGAWVKTDAPLPGDVRVFPPDDSRADHVMVYPEECSPLPSQD